MCGKGGYRVSKAEFTDGRNWTLISSISEVGNFLFDHFHSHLLPNDLSFWQFSASFEIFTNCGKLPKCKVIRQKMVVKLIKFVLKFFLTSTSK